MNKPHGSAIGDWLRTCASLNVQEPEAYAHVARLLGLELDLPKVEIKSHYNLKISEKLTITITDDPIEKPVEPQRQQEPEPPQEIIYLQPIRTERPSAKDLQKPMLTIQSKEELNQAIFLPGGGVLTSSDLVVWDEESGERETNLYHQRTETAMALGMVRHAANPKAYIVQAIFKGGSGTERVPFRRMPGKRSRLHYQIFALEEVTDVACSIKSPNILFVNQRDKVRVAFQAGWAVERGEITVNGAQLISIAAENSPDPQIIITGDQKGTVCIIKKGAASIESRGIYALPAHEGSVYTLAFSPDGKTFASGAGDHMVKIWGTDNRALIYTLNGHTDSISFLAYHPSQPILASGSADTTIRLWHTATGQCRLTLSPGRSPITSVAWNADGSRLLASSWDGQVHLWDFAVLQALMAEKPQTAAPASPSGGSQSPAADPPPRTRLQPLFQPEWQAGLIHGLASARQMGQALDLLRLVDQAARLQPFHVLPRRHDFRGGSRVQLLIDRDDQMMAFLQDSKALEKECRRLLGKEALDIQRFHGDPTEGAGPGPIWDWSPYQPPAPGTHIVLVSNLGAMPWHEDFESPRWRRFARRVADAGCHLTCLSPLRPTRYSPGLVRTLRIVFWDRRTQLAHIHRLAHP